MQESKRNQLKDFVNIAGPLGVSHFMILTATQHSCYLRIAKVPRVCSSHPKFRGLSTVLQLLGTLPGTQHGFQA